MPKLASKNHLQRATIKFKIVASPPINALHISNGRITLEHAPMHLQADDKTYTITFAPTLAGTHPVDTIVFTLTSPDTLVAYSKEEASRNHTRSQTPPTFTQEELAGRSILPGASFPKSLHTLLPSLTRRSHLMHMPWVFANLLTMGALLFTDRQSEQESAFWIVSGIQAALLLAIMAPRITAYLCPQQPPTQPADNTDYKQASWIPQSLTSGIIGIVVAETPIKESPSNSVLMRSTEAIDALILLALGIYALNMMIIFIPEFMEYSRSNSYALSIQRASSQYQQTQEYPIGTLLCLEVSPEDNHHVTPITQEDLQRPVSRLTHFGEEAV